MCRLPHLFTLTVGVCLAVSSSPAQPCDCDGGPDVLEPNFGITAPRNPYVEPAPPPPRYIIDEIAVSPDGRWLAYTGGWLGNPIRLLLKDLITDSLRVLANAASELQWKRSGAILSYVDLTIPTAVYVDMHAGSRVEISGRCDSAPLFISHPLWAIDGNLYFTNALDTQHGSVPGLYRILLDSSLQSRCYVTELFAPQGAILAIPPNEMSWYLSGYKYWEVPGMTIGDVERYQGWSIVRGFDWEKQRRIVRVPLSAFPGADTSTDLHFGGSRWASARSSTVTVGNCGDLYIFVGTASRSERETIQWTDEQIRARATSGWWRVDTNGTDPIQLVRTWSPVGTSVTADEHVFYGYMNPDSTLAVFEMDRCGRGKRQVTFPDQDPYPQVVSIDSERRPVSTEDRIGVVRRGGDDDALVVHADVAGEYSLLLFDVAGRKVTETGLWISGSEGRSVQLRRLCSAPGVYVARLLGPGGKQIASTSFAICK